MSHHRDLQNIVTVNRVEVVQAIGIIIMISRIIIIILFHLKNSITKLELIQILILNHCRSSVDQIVTDPLL